MSDRHISQPAASSEEDIADILDRRFARERKLNGTGNNNTFNGTRNKVVDAVIVGLLLAGISGEVIVYAQVQTLVKTVDLILEGKIKIPQ